MEIINNTNKEIINFISGGRVVAGLNPVIQTVENEAVKIESWLLFCFWNSFGTQIAKLAFVYKYLLPYT